MSALSTSRLSQSVIIHLIHHVFLPPKLPHQDDSNAENETALLDTTVDALQEFRNLVTDDENDAVGSVIAMLTSLKATSDASDAGGIVNEQKLSQALSQLPEKGGIILLRIQAQNAGVMIQRVKDYIHVEAFELSPLNEAVITTKGRLHRSFPGTARALSIDEFTKPDFQSATAHTLAKMSHQLAPGTRPKSSKAGKMHDENRNTTHPKIVTELFMGFLQPIGQLMDLPQLWKHTREEVMWLDTLLPWRRSPVWMLLRVSMQLTFTRLARSENSSTNYYKTFMAFFMGKLLRLSLQHDLHCDLLYAMNAKLGRRLLKLSPCVPTAGIGIVRSIMRETAEHIQARWQKFMQQASPCHNFSSLESLDFEQDVFLSLDRLTSYLESRSTERKGSGVESFQLPAVLANYDAEKLPFLPNEPDEHVVYQLQAFETWVECHLPQWIEDHKGDDRTCGRIHLLIMKYYRTASTLYSGNPESLSQLLLTILELWIACDQSALHLCTLLGDYDPGITPDVFQCLLLPLECQMKRLLRAEKHLKNRNKSASHAAPSVFRDYGESSSFSVRYFNQSSKHQRLRQDIEADATQIRNDKLKELSEKKERYRSLMQNHDKSTCQYYEVDANANEGSQNPRHKSDCRRCMYKTQANAIRIKAHEWPLPEDDLEARSTVFELNVPSFLVQWRDTTLFLLLRVLKARYSFPSWPENTYPLHDYRGLASFFTPTDSRQRLILLSERKPHDETHWLTNGFSIGDEISESLTYRLPAPSRMLQRFLHRSTTTPGGLPPNEVIASQSSCPDHFALDEYKSLCSIPLGYQIQWLNILLQFSAPSVDFKKVETSLVILQSIYQAGPPQDGSVLRASHKLLDDENFATALLKSLDESLGRIRENWESSQEVSTFVSVSARLLSLSASEKIKTRCIQYLKNIRVASMNWINLLIDKMYGVSDDCHRAELLSFVVELSLVCCDTFNVDTKYLGRILALPEDGSTFIQCCIHIHNHTSVVRAASDIKIPILYQRWKSLCFRIYPILGEQILNITSKPLDDAIKKAWSAYGAASGWHIVSEELDYWLFNNLRSASSNKSIVVHYNLVTGDLLVNGLHMARLPSDYERDATYSTLFGWYNLEAMPSTIPGMQFSLKRHHAGYKIHIGMRPILDAHEPELLVRAEKDGRTYELIPSRVLSGDFPEHFTKGFVHWLSVKGRCIEFRPVKDPWSSSPMHWRLVIDPDRHQWHLVKNDLSLISIKSKTAKFISDIFRPLDDSSHLHAVLHHSSSMLEIDLPRLSLVFLLKSGTSELRSKQFRGLCVAPDQSFGTLVGLQDKLLLQNNSNGRRLIIIPEGKVSFQRDGDHVRATIAKESLVKAHVYAMDERLGRLEDKGDLQSKLWLCYLHAITSFCLPDPLLSKTGTEQALSILGSAAVRSFERLDQENVDILHHIAQLTAGRSYYPPNERVMQTVTWANGLNFLAQHGEFYKHVKLIFQQDEDAKVFNPRACVKHPVLNHVEEELLDRDCIRSSTFRVSGFGAEAYTTEYDATYSARDQGQHSSECRNVYVTSNFVFSEKPTISHPIPSGWSNGLWEFLANYSPIFGPNRPIPHTDLKYDAGLLQDGAEFVAKNWCGLHRRFSGKRTCVNKYSLMIWLSTLAFAGNCDIVTIQTLGSFLIASGMTKVVPPVTNVFELSEGRDFSRRSLHDALEPALKLLSQCPESNLDRNKRESDAALRERKQLRLEKNQSRLLSQLIQTLESQWPCEYPVLPEVAEFSTYMHMNNVAKIVQQKFKTWYDNQRLNLYIIEVEKVLLGLAVVALKIPSTLLVQPGIPIVRRRNFISIDDVFSGPPPSTRPSRSDNLADILLGPTNTNNASPRLDTLVDDVDSLASCSFEVSYAEDLRASLQSLKSWDKQHQLSADRESVKAILSTHLGRCEKYVQKTYTMILDAITCHLQGQASEPTFVQNNLTVLIDVAQWPRMSPILLLHQLCRHRWQKITEGWRLCLVSYAIALTDVQRAERLRSLANNRVALMTELRNPGHTNWDPVVQPESLLLEAESSFLIRSVQADIARQMRDVVENSTMQLNMGEGKSSVIVPVVAAALADGSRLVRIVTAKPQVKQMFQMLVSKLGGLLDRQVYHMPFSRSVPLGQADAAMVDHMCRQCMVNGGVVLMQPEHILSFKLMGLESLITGKNEIGRSLLCIQDFFDSSTRDIVDESDENFNVKFELVYTMGNSRPVDLSPQRWTCIHQVLNLVKACAPKVAREVPSSMEIYEGPPGSFPRTRILDSDGQWLLCTKIAEQICETGLDGFPIARQPKPVRESVFRYLIEHALSPSEISPVERQYQSGIWTESTSQLLLERQYQSGFWTESTSQLLLLLRGLLAGGVLPFALRQKRWRVHYGPDANRQPRTKLAVPYRAKDCPTLQSEFSHPDVIIVLTCLSHYYGGITDDDLFLAFDHLLKSDHADIEYQEWVKDVDDLSVAFRQLSGINLKDRVQCIKDVFPPLRYVKSVIDYFLTHVVFPKEMREFPHKLSASGWDIGQVKTLPTSGFSGTSDSRMTLPLSVTHLDLEAQKHTNALVLEHLLRPENTVSLIPPQTDAKDSVAESFIGMVSKMNPRVQVILDVGAQILELSNVEVAKEWLKKMQNHKQVQAIVYFSTDDELSVLDRKGRIERLQTSPFADQLDLCLIFLDEAHTRGTDLKLPENYRAAVTLGANLTKDRLIQACMRMRKLGHGQSVVFCVPEEIKTKLLLLKNVSEFSEISVSDILCWTITETWADIRRSMPLWAVQGRRFEQQRELWANARVDGKLQISKIQAEDFLEEEALSLQHRYQPRVTTNFFTSFQADQNLNVQRIADRCLEFNGLDHDTASLQEEQERELAPEVEQEREVQKPVSAKSAKHEIHPDLRAFVNDGILQPNSKAFKPAFETLRETSAAAYLDVSQFPADVHVTCDFARTVESSSKFSNLDAFQRPVQWILTSIGDDDDDVVKYMVIISPYEAEAILTEVRCFESVMLHLYTPRPNLGIRCLDRLDLYVVPTTAKIPEIPSSFIVQLNLFAGQLHFDSFKEYVEVCKTLGLAWEKVEDGTTLAADGFILSDSNGQITSTSSFSQSPVMFLRVHMTQIRKNCAKIDKTHMGAVLGGRLLLPSDFGEAQT